MVQLPVFMIIKIYDNFVVVSPFSPSEIVNCLFFSIISAKYLPKFIDGSSMKVYASEESTIVAMKANSKMLQSGITPYKMLTSVTIQMMWYK